MQGVLSGAMFMHIQRNAAMSFSVGKAGYDIMYTVGVKENIAPY